MSLPKTDCKLCMAVRYVTIVLFILIVAWSFFLSFIRSKTPTWEPAAITTTFDSNTHAAPLTESDREIRLRDLQATLSGTSSALTLP